MRTDYILDSNFDLIYNNNGDGFLIGNSDQTNKAVNILVGKGGIRNYIRIGADIRNELNGKLDQNVKRKILESFKRDGYNLRGITFDGDQINIP